MTQELVLQNIAITEIMKKLQSHVQNEMFFKQQPPDKNRRRYNPSRRDVQNFIHGIRSMAQIPMKDLEQLQDDFQELQDADSDSIVYFVLPDDAKRETSEELMTNKAKRLAPLKMTQFIFFYQTSFQRHLLQKYGNIVYLVEVTPDENARKALTVKMYLLMVQTNADHQIVGCIIYNKHNPNALKDALNVCKESNSSFWSPKILMVDFTDDLLEAVAEVFPGKFLFTL